MPFIRQSRDKRGFDHTYVMHVARGAGGQQQMRVLYVFRSPANLQIGRTALDAEVREALEHTHPDLNFDWNALTRDAVTTRSEPAGPRQSRNQRSARPAPRPPSPPGPPSPPSPGTALSYVIPAEDASLLGQVLGVAEAARVRARYNELAQRIGRRSRSPEERDRLLQKARRLNPDEWPDEAAIRAQAPAMDRECESVAAELPSRRRGRRGGRRRVEEGGATGSGIMAVGEDAPNPPTTYAEFEGARVDAPGGAGGAGGDAGVGPAGSPEADLPGGD